MSTSLKAEIVTRVEEVAKKRGISMAQVAVAWTLSKEGGVHKYDKLHFERLV
jgi:aryl-alcohol dehydrogenase-like predicted oxidoreductase